MKIISKISKVVAGSELAMRSKLQVWSWAGECLDGEVVSLSTWMTDHAVQEAYCWHKRDPRNIWKVMATNRFVPLGHKLGGYTTYDKTTVLFS